MPQGQQLIDLLLPGITETGGIPAFDIDEGLLRRVLAAETSQLSTPKRLDSGSLTFPSGATIPTFVVLGMDGWVEDRNGVAAEIDVDSLPRRDGLILIAAGGNGVTGGSGGLAVVFAGSECLCIALAGFAGKGLAGKPAATQLIGKIVFTVPAGAGLPGPTAGTAFVSGEDGCTLFASGGRGHKGGKGGSGHGPVGHLHHLGSGFPNASNTTVLPPSVGGNGGTGGAGGDSFIRGGAGCFAKAVGGAGGEGSDAGAGGSGGTVFPASSVAATFIAAADGTYGSGGRGGDTFVILAPNSAAPLIAPGAGGPAAPGDPQAAAHGGPAGKDVSP